MTKTSFRIRFKNPPADELKSITLRFRSVRLSSQLDVTITSYEPIELVSSRPDPDPDPVGPPDPDPDLPDPDLDPDPELDI